MSKVNYGSYQRVDTNDKKREQSTLTQACKEGNYELVKTILDDPTIDICTLDQHGMSPIEYALKNNHLHCAALIRKEAYYRCMNPSNEYTANLRAKLNTSEDLAFDENLFGQAVENDPQEALKYLTRFVSQTRREIGFNNLDLIFGVNSVKTSALASVLNESIIPSQTEKKLGCLEHIVFKRVLDIKWELFGARMYYRQLLFYLLMLVAMTNDILLENVEKILKDLEQSNKTIEDKVKFMTSDNWIQALFAVWIFTFLFCFFGSLHVFLLRPQCFLKLSHWMYNGKFKIDFIPQPAVFKAKARFWILCSTIVVTTLMFIAIVSYLKYLMSIDDFDTIWLISLKSKNLNSIVLWLCALYFVFQEIREVIGEDPWIYEKIRTASYLKKVFWILVLFLLPFATPFLPAYRKYYASFINKLQLITYLMILGPYTYIDWFVGGEDRTWYYILGAICSTSLWILSLQYLEVNKAAGYLLPIVQDVLRDVWNFVIFYGVFQCGLACAFYFIFQQQSVAYKTLWASFCSTYFVLFGDNSGDEFDNEALTEFMKDFGWVLRMFHCAVMAILLVNLLIAMMNKTVDRNWEKLQSRAMTSYARAILRFETMLGHSKETRKKLIEISLPGQGRMLHPIFSEEISKHEFGRLKLNDNDQEDEHTALINEANEIATKNEKIQKEVNKLRASVQTTLGQVLMAARQQRLSKSSQII